MEPPMKVDGLPAALRELCTTLAKENHRLANETHPALSALNGRPQQPRYLSVVKLRGDIAQAIGLAGMILEQLGGAPQAEPVDAAGVTPRSCRSVAHHGLEQLSAAVNAFVLPGAALRQANDVLRAAPATSATDRLIAALNRLDGHLCALRFEARELLDALPAGPDER